jgi:hypothetical protein
MIVANTHQRTSLGLDKSDKSKPSGRLHSPFFNPPSPTIDRPVLSAQQEAELRNTLIKVLRDINKPSEQVYEEMFWKRKSSKSVTEKPGVEKNNVAEVTKHKKNPSFTVSGPHEGSSSQAGAKRYDSGIAVEPETGATNTRDESQRDSKSGLSIRPVASADDSTLATETTRDVGASAGSTALTSAALTPGDLGKANVFAQGFSKSEPSSATDTTDAQNWMAQEFAKRKSQNVVAPAPASSAQPPSSAVLLTPAGEETTPADNKSKQTNTIAHSSAAAPDRAGAPNHGQDVKTNTPSEGKRVSWWRRASISRRKSNASLKKSKSAGDTPATKSGGRTPNPKVTIPPLPRLDSARWEEKKNTAKGEEERGATEPDSSSPKSPAPKAPLSPIAEPSEEIKRPGSAVIIDEEGEERALSSLEERKRDSDIQGAVKAKMLAGSLHSTPSTPALSAASKKSMEFPRPGSQRSAHSAVKDSSPVREVTESPIPDKTDVAPTPKAVALPARVDSMLASPVENISSTKSTPPTVPRITTISPVTVPKTQVESVTPITPAFEELEDPYASKPLQHARTAEPADTSKLQSRGSSFLKRFSSLKSGPAKTKMNSPVSPAAPSGKELHTQRTAKMKAYSRILETQYEKPVSSHSEDSDRDSRQTSRTSKLLNTTGNPIRSASPTPSDLYAL